MVETVAALIGREARIRWYCDVGRGHSGDLDLQRVASLRGADVILANRRPPCPTPGCPGRVQFKDETRVFGRSLDTIQVHDPAGFAYIDQRREELKALGYRMVMGKWVAPDKSRPDR